VLFRGRVAIQDDPTLAKAGRMGRNDYWRRELIKPIDGVNAKMGQ